MEPNSVFSKSLRGKKSSSKPNKKVSSDVLPELMLFPISSSYSIFQTYISVLSSAADVSTELTLCTGSGNSCSSGNSSSSINSTKRKSINQEQEQGQGRDHQFAKKLKPFEEATWSPSSTSNINGMISEIDLAHGLDLRLSLFSSPPPPPPLPLSHDYHHQRQEQEQKVAAEAHEDDHHEGGHDQDYQQRYNIRKTLENSDVSANLGRLLLGIELVESHVLSVLSERNVEDVKSGKGTKVMVRDMDEGSDHSMMFKKLRSSKSYVFNSDWTHQFLRRRQLCVGDTIGMYWDPEAKQFCFSVLQRAPRVVPSLINFL